MVKHYKSTSNLSSNKGKKTSPTGLLILTMEAPVQLEFYEITVVKGHFNPT